mmetsp:Transcript_17336/g.26262  ORF Transcript_17336/g.26262 Transcript_17336/m.26262 type:complete len:130 (-) Transcript_17336:574-963(-)
MSTRDPLRSLRSEKDPGQGIDRSARSLIVNGENSNKHAVIPSLFPKTSLSDNGLGSSFQNAVRSASQLENGGYILPETSNFPVVDSLFVSSREKLSLSNEGGSKQTRIRKGRKHYIHHSWWVSDICRFR